MWLCDIQYKVLSYLGTYKKGPYQYSEIPDVHIIPSVDHSLSGDNDRPMLKCLCNTNDFATDPCPNLPCQYQVDGSPTLDSPGLAQEGVPDFHGYIRSFPVARSDFSAFVPDVPGFPRK